MIGLDFVSYRIVNDHGEPCLFRKVGFKTVDDTIPDDWVWDSCSDDEYYADPPELGKPGFHEATSTTSRKP